MSRPILPEAPAERDRYADRHRLFRRMANVSAVFSLIVIFLLALNHARIQWDDPLDSERLKTLIAQLEKNPKDEGIKKEIRELDQALRAEYFRRQGMAVKGAWLLFGGVAIFILSLYMASRYRPVPPSPAPDKNPQERIVRELVRARTAAVVFGAIMLVCGGAIFLGFDDSSAKTAPTDPKPGDGAAKKVAVEPERLPTSEEIARNWPRFRGPSGSGVANHTNFPVNWNVETGENILWKWKPPLPGMSSPVIWNDRVFLSGADKQRRAVYCVDLKKGTMLWSHEVTGIPGSPVEAPEVFDDNVAQYAASTVATDGHRVYAIYANGDLIAVDASGKEVWATSLGIPDNMYGHAQSLLTWKRLLIVPWDQDSKAKLIAYDGATGEVAWEIDRKVEGCWTTPILITTQKGEQIITVAPPKVVAYDPENGKEIWSFTGIEGGEAAASPVFGGGLLSACGNESNLFAIDPNGAGDVTKSHLKWEAEDGVPDTPSPVTDGSRLWALTAGGDLTCYEVATGKKLFEKAIDGEFYASPTLIGDRLLLLARDGKAFFVSAKPEDKGKELGQLSLGEGVDASPAFSDGRMLIRGATHLFCVGKK